MATTQRGRLVQVWVSHCEEPDRNGSTGRWCYLLVGHQLGKLNRLYMGRTRPEALAALNELNERRRALGLPQIEV